MAVCDEHHVQLIQWLVHKAHIVLFDRGVLGAGVCQLGERGEKGFHARPWHLPELSGEDSFPATGTDRRREDNLDLSELPVAVPEAVYFISKLTMVTDEW